MSVQKWDKKWKKRDVERPNNFAVRVLKYIKDKKVKSILDLGCGVGRDSIFFYKNGYDVTALDSSEEALKTLKKKFLKLNA